MSIKAKLSNLVGSQLPEFIREDYQQFVLFLETYYEYLEQTVNNDYDSLGDIDKTLDGFVQYFKNYLAYNIPQSLLTTDSRFLLQHMKDLYSNKGNESAYKLLFRILFNKEVEVLYPSEQILKVSDGKWVQDNTVFIKTLIGTPDLIDDANVTVITPTKQFYVAFKNHSIAYDGSIPSTDTFEHFAEIHNIKSLSVGDIIEYKNQYKGVIVQTPNKMSVVQGGTGFKAGQIYRINQGSGTNLLLKVKSIGTNGALSIAEFISYGINYPSSFTIYLSSNPVYNNGGYNVDYATYMAVSGNVASDLAKITITSGVVAKYPGYYRNNDGFLNDACYIQDGYYYQQFSYALKIDELLSTYKSVVKSLLHPAGTQLFGQYSINNTFNLDTTMISYGNWSGTYATDSIVATESMLRTHYPYTANIGKQLTTGRGTLTTNQSIIVALTGNNASISRGILTPIESFTLTGKQLSSNRGTLSTSQLINVTLSGNAGKVTAQTLSTVATSNLAINNSVTLSGSGAVFKNPYITITSNIYWDNTYTQSTSFN